MAGIVISTKKKLLIGKRIKEVEVPSSTLNTALFFNDLVAVGVTPNTSLLSQELGSLPVIAKNEASTVLVGGTTGIGNVFGMNGDTKSIEGFSFSRNSAATRWSWDGKMYPVGVNDLRYDQDPKNGSFNGMLFEKASTNLLTYSGFTRGLPDVLPGSTNVSAVTTSWNKGTLLDKGIKMTYSASATVFAYKYYNTAVVGRSYVFSCYVKMSDGQSPAGGIGIHLFGTGFTTFNQEDCGGGVFLIWVVINLASAQTSSVGIFKATTSDTRDVVVSGFQLEEGGIPTSYIPCEESSTSRLEDVLTSNRAIDLFDQYSVFMKGSYRANRLESQSSMFFMKDMTARYWFSTYSAAQPENIRAYNGIGGITVVASERIEHKVVVRRNIDNYSMSVDGGAVQTDNTVFPLINQPIVIRGSQSSFTLRALAIIPRKLTNQELQTITS